MPRSVLSSLACALLLAAASTAADPLESALEAFRRAHGPSWSFSRQGPLLSLQGGSAAWLGAGAGGHLSSQPQASEFQARALVFVREQQELLGLDPAALRPGTNAFVLSTDGHLAVLHLEHAPGGIPVLGARLSFVVVSGRLVAVHATGLEPVSGDPLPSLAEADAIGIASRAATLETGRSSRARAALAWLRQDGGHRLAWSVELLAEEKGTPSRPVALVDARSGELISLTDEARTTCSAMPPGGLERRVMGGVRPERADEPERLELLPHVEIAGQPSDADGFFLPPATPHAARLEGPHVRLTCASCSAPAVAEAVPGASGDIDFGIGGRDETGNGASTPSDRTAWFHVEGARRLAAGRLTLPFLQQPVRVVTNAPNACNAYWDGQALTFFRSSPRCGNTGEIRDVIVHEYGHALDEHDGLPPSPVGVDAATGEAIADILAMLRSRDACIGESFYSDPADWPSLDCSGVRDLDESAPGHRRGTLDATSIATSCAPATAYRGVLGYQGHCEGEMLGQAFWHLVQNLRTGRSQADGRPLATGAFGDEAAWLLAEQLFFRALPLIASQAPASAQSIGMSAWEAFLLADDEGDGIANGTPHAEALHDAFAHHGLVETPTAPPTGTPCTPPLTPAIVATEGLDPGSGLPTVQVDWSDAGAATYRILRADDAVDGLLPIGPAFGPGAGSFTDRALLPGRSYRYVVLAESAGGCPSVSAPATGGTGPRVEALAVRVDDGADSLLERGETSDLLVDLINRGGSAATNMQLELVSDDPGLLVLDPGPVLHGLIAPGATSSAPAAFRVSALATAPRFVTLRLEGVSSEGCQRSEFALEIAQPVLRLADQRLDDTAGGDGDLSWEAGEQATLDFLLRNEGLLPARILTATLALRPGAPAGITLVRDSAAWADVASNDAGWTLAPGFELAASLSVPARSLVPLRLEVFADGAPLAGFDAVAEVGGLPPGTLEWTSLPGIDHTVNPIVLQLDDDDGDGVVDACDRPDVLVRAGWGAGASLWALHGDGSGELWRLTDPCFNMGSGSQLAGGDIDGDGANEIVVMARDGITCAISAGGTVKWRASVIAQASQVAAPSNMSASPQLRDLDGDGVVEVIVGYTVLDGRDGSLVWEKFVNNRGQVLVVDLDLDGSEEILGGVEPQGPVFADTRTWRASGAPFGVTFPGLFWGSAAADLDGDAEAEVVWVDTLTGLNAANPDGSLVFPRWEPGPLTQIIGTYQPCLGDFDGDGLAEIAAPVQGRLVLIDGDGTESWSIVTDGDWFGACSAFDFDQDGRPEVVHHDRSMLRIIDGLDGSIRWEVASPMPYDPWQGPTIADVDGDGAAEILVIGGAGPFDGALQVFGSPSWPAARRVWNQHPYSGSHVREDGAIASPASPWWATTSGNGYRLQSGACPCDATAPGFDHVFTCGTTSACFDGDAAGPDAVSHQWDFGDGSPLVSGSRACHDFGTPGPRVVTLRVVDVAGCGAEAAAIVDIPAPLSLAVPTTLPCADRSECLSVVVSGGVAPVDVAWSLPDGSRVAGDVLCRAWPAGRHRLIVSAQDSTRCAIDRVVEIDVAGAPADVGPSLRATSHGDPWSADCEASFEWSADRGAPRLPGETYVVMRGVDPSALARLPGPGLVMPSLLDSTPTSGATFPPFIHYYSIHAEGDCGVSLD